MSTDYAETLKRIKDAEEASNREVSDRKKQLEAELTSIEETADKSIEDSKKDAEAYVTSAGEAAEASAQREADAMLASAKKKADQIAAKKLDKKELGKIVESIVFSEFKGE